MVMVGDSFEAGFESDECRSLHNGPTIPFVTPRAEKFFGVTGF
jgi:hypothetical protein